VPLCTLHSSAFARLASGAFYGTILCRLFTRSSGLGSLHHLKYTESNQDAQARSSASNQNARKRAKPKTGEIIQMIA